MGKPEASAVSLRRVALLKDAAAFGAALLTALAVARGLLLAVPSVQAALLVGVAAGLLATGDKRAVAIAALAACVAPALIRPYQLDRLALGPIVVQIALMAAGAALIAFGVRRAVVHHPTLAVVFMVGTVVLLLVNLSAFTVLVELPDGRPVADHLSEVPPPNTQLTDNEFYQRVLGLMAQGSDYYHAFRQAYHENTRWGTDPKSALGYRLPTFFWFWTLLPGKPWSILIAWLLLAATSMFAAVRLAMVRAPIGFAIPAVVGIAAYLLNLGTTNSILATESWTGMLGLVALTAAVVSYHSDRWQAWTWLAVGVALLAALTRELMVFVIVGGLAASLFAREDERTRRGLYWGIGGVLFLAGYVSHAARVSAAVSGAQGAEAYFNGGFAYLANAFTWASTYLGGPGLLAVFAVLAIVAAVRAPSRSERVLCMLCSIGPLAAFLVIGNDATTNAGTPVNYWAPVVMPILIGMSPWSLPSGLLSFDGPAVPRRT